MVKIDDYYQQNAQTFFQQTINVDMGPLHTRFLEHVPGAGRILDAGCGSGRDAKVFLNAGYYINAFDASSALAQLASNYLDQSVGVLRFEDITYDEEFDGVWACASLLHVPLCDLPGVFINVFRALKPGGVFYASFKYGRGEFEKDGRKFTNMDEGSFTILLKQVGKFKVIDIWVSEDSRPDRQKEYWLNALLKA